MKNSGKRLISMVLSVLLLAAFMLPVFGETKAVQPSQTSKETEKASPVATKKATDIPEITAKATSTPKATEKAGTDAPSNQPAQTPKRAVTPKATEKESPEATVKSAASPAATAKMEDSKTTLTPDPNVTPEPTYGIIPPLEKVEDYSTYYFTKEGAWVLGTVTTDERGIGKGYVKVRVVYPEGVETQNIITAFNVYDEGSLRGRIAPSDAKGEEAADYFEGMIEYTWASTPAPVNGVGHTGYTATPRDSDIALIPLIKKDGKEQEVEGEEIVFQQGALAMVKPPEKDKEDRLILRKAPGSAGEILGNYYGGVYLTLTHHVDETWAKVKVGTGSGAAIGYMNKNYLFLEDEVLKGDLFKPTYDEKLGLWKKHANTAIKKVVGAEMKMLTQPKDGAATLKVFRGIQNIEIMGIFYDWYPTMIDGKYGFIHTSSIYVEETPMPTVMPTPKPTPALTPEPTAVATPEVFPDKLSINYQADIGYKAVAKVQAGEEKGKYVIEITLAYNKNFITNAPMQGYEIYINGIKAGELAYAFGGEKKLPTYFKGEVMAQEEIEAMYLVPVLQPKNEPDNSNIINIFPKNQSANGDNG